MIVIKPGTRVRLSVGKDAVVGTVTAVCLRDKSITYEIVWWDGRIRKCEWVSEGEAIPIEGSSETKLGFREV